MDKIANGNTHETNPFARALQLLGEGQPLEAVQQELLQQGLSLRNANLVLRQALRMLGRSDEAADLPTTGRKSDFQQMFFGFIGLVFFVMAGFVRFAYTSSGYDQAAVLFFWILVGIGVASLQASFAPRFRRFEEGPTETLSSRRKWGLVPVFFALLVLGSGLVGAIYLWNRTDMDAVERHIQTGREAIQKSKWGDAITASNAALEIDPTSAGAHLIRGIAHAGKGATEHAMADFDEVLGTKWEPKNALIRYLAYYNRGLVYSSKRNFERAISDLNEAINLFEDAQHLALPQEQVVSLNEVYYQRASAHLFMHHEADALNDVNAALKLKKNDPAYLALREKIQIRMNTRAFPKS